MYNISWVAVLHKYGSILHLLSVLQNNPNKEIYVYAHDKNDMNIQLLKPIVDSNKFSNLHVEVVPWTDPHGWFNYDSAIIEEKIREIKGNNKKVDIYLDDYRLLKPLSKYREIIDDETEVKNANINIMNKFAFLGLCRSVNMFADGTASWGFFSSKIYELINYLSIPYDWSTQSYPKINELRREMYVNGISNLSFKDELFSGLIILQSLVSANYKDENGIQVSKFFLPGTDTILDLNSSASLNSQEIKRQVFDPYYSLDASIIMSYKNLSEESKNLFHAIFNVTPQSKEFMNGKTSIIYSGRNIADHGDDVLTAEAKRIINLYKINGGLTDNNVQVVFKGHPRDTDDYDNKIKNKITQLDSSLNPDVWLKFLNRKIPMEYYVFDGFLSSDATVNRKVIYYSGLSTIFYFLQAAGLDKDVKNVIVSNSDMNNILKWNGYPSRVFKDQIILSETELDQNNSL